MRVAMANGGLAITATYQTFSVSLAQGGPFGRADNRAFSTPPADHSSRRHPHGRDMRGRQ